MTHPSDVQPATVQEANDRSFQLSVVPHDGGWAIKHGDSLLGSIANLADALTVMAALADHAPGPAKANGGHRLRAA